MGHPEVEEEPVGKVVMYGSVSVDGFVADQNDQPGPLFDWLSSGDVPMDESGQVKVSQTSYDYTRPYWDQIGATIVGRHVFDMTDGWDGTPPGGVDHVVVVTHRPKPEGWDVKGQQDLLVGGLLVSLWADTLSPCPRTPNLLCLSGQGDDASSGGGVGEPE
jgi:hypothetical protein